jgi:hypothetical protein
VSKPPVFSVLPVFAVKVPGSVNVPDAIFKALPSAALVPLFKVKLFK